MGEQPPGLTYSRYLKLDRVLNAQELVSEKRGIPTHDEMLFIIVHQTYELWFKELLHDLDSLLHLFNQNFIDEKNIGVAVSRLSRIVQIEKLMIEQIKVLETMTALDFLEFRNDLTGASGFQSVQFRLFENKLGLKPEQRLKYGDRHYFADFSEEEEEAVKKAEACPTLFDGIQQWLERTPFLHFGDFHFVEQYRSAFRRMQQGDKNAVTNSSAITAGERELRLNMIGQASEYVENILDEKHYEGLRSQGAVRLSYSAFIGALFITLYRDQPILHLPYRLLTQILEIDEYLTLWRYRHSLMVLRMIGSKMGTGGSTGHEYLTATIEKHRIFLDLFKLSTLLIPRSELPLLPKELERTLAFHFTVQDHKP